MLPFGTWRLDSLGFVELTLNLRLDRHLTLSSRCKTDKTDFVAVKTTKIVLHCAAISISKRFKSLN